MLLSDMRRLVHGIITDFWYDELFCSAATLTVEDVASLRHFTRDQIKLTMFLGSGAFGEVFEGVATNILSENSGSTKVAVKVGFTTCVVMYFPV